MTNTTQPPKTPPVNGPAKSGFAHPAPRADVDLPKERAEESEVAGRHKNSGQKDHKGAR